MVFCSFIVLSVAHLSADASQSIARFPDPLTSHQLLYLLFAFPLQQLSRLALSLWTLFCVPPPGSFYYYYYSSDSDLSSYDYASDWFSLVISPPFCFWVFIFSFSGGPCHCFVLEWIHLSLLFLSFNSLFQQLLATKFNIFIIVDPKTLTSAMRFDNFWK